MADGLSLAIKDRVAIVGIGNTPFGRGFPESEESLASIALTAALEDAGIAPQDVNGIAASTYLVADEEEIVRDLGLGDITFYARSPGGGGGACGVVGLAAMAIATGQSRVAVAVHARKRSGKASRPWVADATNRVSRPREMWTKPFGIIRPVDEIALITQRYMYDFGATREHLFNVALAARSHANRNPGALMHDKVLTRDAYYAARWICEPLGLFDCCLENDGAIAFVLVASERARDCRQKPAYIHAFAQGITRDSVGISNFYTEDFYNTQAHATAQLLWRNSDFKPADVDVAQIYDAFTPEVLISLESFGFCGRGEGGPFTEGCALHLGGRLPTNTAGGNLSEAYLHGFAQILEGVRQVRGTSTSQVSDVRCSFVSSSDVVPNSALLLRS